MTVCSQRHSFISIRDYNYNRRERKWNSDRILPENDHQDFEFGTGRDNEDLEKDFCFSDSNSEPEDAQHDKGQ